MTIVGESHHDNKKRKEKLTLLLCVNMDGSEKLKPLIIEKSVKPKFFSDVQSFPIDCLNK